MIAQTPTDNIISFTDKLNDNKDRETALVNRKIFRAHTRVISITSGKGGVGKTNMAANLGLGLSKRGKKVLILDADLGLGNLDILLGLSPTFNFSHVLKNKRKIKDILIEAASHLSILPASSGMDEFTHLNERQRLMIFRELNSIVSQFDVLLIDTAAGISPAVMYFNTLAEDIVIVVSPEPSAITDAYALMKVLSIKYAVSNFKLLINQVKNPSEADRVFMQLRLVTEKFIDITLDYLGHVEYDRNLAICEKNQLPIVEMFPDSIASQCIIKIVEKIIP